MAQFLTPWLVATSSSAISARPIVMVTDGRGNLCTGTALAHFRSDLYDANHNPGTRCTVCHSASPADLSLAISTIRSRWNGRSLPAMSS